MFKVITLKSDLLIRIFKKQTPALRSSGDTTESGIFERISVCVTRWLYSEFRMVCHPRVFPSHVIGDDSLAISD